jgi:ketosteroid isomerase-like protein
MRYAACVYREVRKNVDANLALVRRKYDLWNSGGAGPLVEHIWQRDVVFHEVPEMPDAGVYRGADAVAGRMPELVEAAGHFQITVSALEACGDYVLASCQLRATGRFTGLRITHRLFHVLRCGGGRVREFRAHFDPQRARRDFEQLCAARTATAP